MEPQKPKTSAKDFFIHLAAMASLYWVVGALLNLLHRVINVAYPQVNDYGSYGYFFSPDSIAWPVSSLIVIFPLFLFFASLTYKSYSLYPEKLELPVRKWFVYITLFLSGAILAGSIISVIYTYLSGLELAASFLLKVLAWLIVVGVVFGYYLRDIAGNISVVARKKWMIASIVLVVGSIVIGFLVIGSPRTHRLANYDRTKIVNLQDIQSQIIQYWQQKRALPETLDELKDPLSSYYSMPIDPQSGNSYIYRKIDSMSFELCAEFNLESRFEENQPRISNAYKYVGIENENWQHGLGLHCFSRSIDPERYPVFPKPL